MSASQGNTPKFLPTVSDLSVCSPFKPPAISSRRNAAFADSDLDSLPVIRVKPNDDGAGRKTSVVSETGKSPTNPPMSNRPKSSTAINVKPTTKPIVQARPIGAKTQQTANSNSKPIWRPTGIATTTAASKTVSSMPSKTVIQPTKTDACVGPDDSQFVSTAVQCCHPCLNCGWTKEDSREKLQPVAQTIQNKPTVTAPNPIITELDDSFEEEEISYDENDIEEKENFPRERQQSPGRHGGVTMDKRFLQNIMENLKKTLGSEVSQPEKRKEKVREAPICRDRHLIPRSDNSSESSRSHKTSRDSQGTRPSGREIAVVQPNSVSVHMNALAEKYLSREELSKFHTGGFQQSPPKKTFTVAKKQMVSTFEYSVFEVPSGVESNDTESLSFVSRNYVARNMQLRSSAAATIDFRADDCAVRQEYRRDFDQHRGYNEVPRRDHQDLSTIEERSEFTTASNFRNSNHNCACPDCRTFT